MNSAALNRHPNPLFPCSMLAATFCLLGWKRRRAWPLLLALVTVGLGVCTGCVGNARLISTQPTVSTVTVTATAGSQQPISTTLTLTLQQAANVHCEEIRSSRLPI
jgi:hypothetical protein